MKNERLKFPHTLKKLDDQLRINEEQWSSKHFVSKNYIRASKRGNELQRQMNPLWEKMYHTLVESMKELCRTLPIEDERYCIEINLKQHPMHCEGLHIIQTRHFHLHLECTYNYDYRIEYSLYKCPLEKELHTLLERFSLTQIATQTHRHNYIAFFNRCLQVQPNEFICIL